LSNIFDIPSDSSNEFIIHGTKVAPHPRVSSFISPQRLDKKHTKLHEAPYSTVDTPEPSDEALEQVMITVMKHSINLMLLCGVPLLYGRPWSIERAQKCLNSAITGQPIMIKGHTPSH
jgi:hypothetical protein